MLLGVRYFDLQARVLCSVKQHGLCQHWFFLRWVARRFTSPKDLLEGLNARLGARTYRYCAALTEHGVFEVILRFEKGGFPTPRHDLVPSPVSTCFDATLSEAWTLDCCLRTLVPEAEFWRYRLQDRPGELIFGDKDLPQDFLNEAKTAARAATVASHLG